MRVRSSLTFSDAERDVFRTSPDNWPVRPVSLATSAIDADTARVRSAAPRTLRVISSVAAPCCSTAAEIVVAISLRLSMIEPISPMAVTDSPVAF